MEKADISVAIATFNEAENIERCLSSIASWVKEIIVVDGGSTDDTVLLARRFHAKVIQKGNPAIFHVNKQRALDECHSRWILQLDADEVVSEDLKAEIIRTTGKRDAYDGYYIPRRNYFLKDWLRKGGQYPDYVIRFFQRGKGSFPQKSVHEQIAVEGSIGRLTQPLDHYSYTSVSQYWTKSSIYIRLAAIEISNRKDKDSFMTMLSYLFIKPVSTFFALFIRHKGFIDGWRGFLFALFSAMHSPKAYWMYRTSL